jgi:hypothetical protein
MFSSFARSRESANSEINGLIYTNLELCIQFNLKIRGISQWWWCAMCKRLTNLSINLLRVNYNFLHQINFSVGKKTYYFVWIIRKLSFVHPKKVQQEIEKKFIIFMVQWISHARESFFNFLGTPKRRLKPKNRIHFDPHWI